MKNDDPEKDVFNNASRAKILSASLKKGEEE